MKLAEDRIEAKIQFIKKNIGILKPLAELGEAEFSGDVRNFYTAVHALQISIEAMLDVLTHIVARLHLGAPTNDREMLEAMLNSKLIPESHFQRYFQMSKFRNKVVHGYMDVDAKKVYAMIRNELGDFELFFGDVKKIIETERAKEKNAEQKKANSKR